MTIDGRSLGKWLQDARVSKRLTLLEIAPSLGIDPTWVGEIESDRRIASEALLEDFVRILGLDLAEARARAGFLNDLGAEEVDRRPGSVVLTSEGISGEIEWRLTRAPHDPG